MRTLFLVENMSVPTDPRVWPECVSLRDAGWDVTVIGPLGNARDTARAETVDGIHVHRYPPRYADSGIRSYAREYASATYHMRKLVHRLAREAAFDVVHAASPPDFLLLSARALRAYGTAAIFDHHDLSPELYEVKFGRRAAIHAVLRAAERLGFALADVVISTNESFRRLAIERGGCDPADVFVVRNGPDPTIFRPRTPDPELRKGARHLLGYVGLMAAQDGVIEAIEALGMLADIRNDWHAVFVGEGEMREEALRRARALGIGEMVSFPGFVRDRDQLAQIIATCDVCLSPEPANPLNDQSTLIKVAEYMSVGRPVVAFELHETSVTAGDAAIYARTTPEFAQLIDKLLTDDARRAQMGAIGRQRATDILGWAHSERALLLAYERSLEIAGERRAKKP